MSSLIKIMNANSGKRPPTSRNHKAIIVDNNDPEKLGRVKIRIPGFIEGSDEDLPWSYPTPEIFQGGSKRSLKMSVPKKGTHINVSFPDGNLYNPRYSGSDIDKKNAALDKFKEDYPHTRGWVDESGNYELYNDKTGKFKSGFVGKPPQEHKMNDEYESEGDAPNDPPVHEKQVDNTGKVDYNSKGNHSISTEKSTVVNSQNSTSVSGGKYVLINC